MSRCFKRTSFRFQESSQKIKLLYNFAKKKKLASLLQTGTDTEVSQNLQLFKMSWQQILPNHLHMHHVLPIWVPPHLIAE